MLDSAGIVELNASTGLNKNKLRRLKGGEIMYLRIACLEALQKFLLIDIAYS